MASSKMVAQASACEFSLARQGWVFWEEKHLY
jgi:hypothetical protein